MGHCEGIKTCKPEKPSSPPPEHQQTGVHAYPDWAAMQAYYGPRIPVPPYFNSSVASGHPPPPPPYMWAPPQHMMPPYAAMYPHPGVPLASPMSIDSPAKSSGNSERGLMKKLKGFDGLAMSIGNGNGISHSGETEGSSEGSDGNTTSGKRTIPPGKVSKTEPVSGNEASKKATALTTVVRGVDGSVRFG